MCGNWLDKYMFNLNLVPCYQIWTMMLIYFFQSSAHIFILNIKAKASAIKFQYLHFLVYVLTKTSSFETLRIIMSLLNHF